MDVMHRKDKRLQEHRSAAVRTRVHFSELPIKARKSR
uniref:Uncharacterized protein n=1 Tax=Anguilla anguilla TaxID=7936 RepID=A0A0E9U152_ANGAN